MTTAGLPRNSSCSSGLSNVLTQMRIDSGVKEVSDDELDPADLSLAAAVTRGEFAFSFDGEFEVPDQDIDNADMPLFGMTL